MFYLDIPIGSGVKIRKKAGDLFWFDESRVCSTDIAIHSGMQCTIICIV
jgi:hypothetical protein